jgi:threonine dehydratase
VQAEGAPSYALSFEAGHPVSTNRADTYADGVATRVPVPEAVSVINAGAARIVTVSDRAILEAQAALLTDTHNLAEPAGAAPLAALTKEKARLRGKRAGIVLSGGNADAENVRRIAEIAATGA